MSLEGDYYQERTKVIRASLRAATHNYDPAEDPGWQAELDDEILDDAVVEMAAAINAKKEATKQLKPKDIPSG